MHNRKLKLAVDEIIEIYDFLNKLSSDYSFFVVEGSITKLKMDNKEFEFLTNCKEYLQTFLETNSESNKMINLIKDYYIVFYNFYEKIEKRVFSKKFIVTNLTNTILELRPIYEKIIEVYNE